MRGAFLIAGVLSLAACGGSRPVDATAPTPSTTPVATTASPPSDAMPEPDRAFHEVPPHAALGEPRGIKERAPAGWWVWADEGGVWHVRTTTAAGAHRFRGRIRSATGFVTDIVPTKAALKEAIKDTHQHGVLVDFHTDREMDGLDFRTSDGGCIRLQLLLDGGPHPKRVFVGEKMLEPPHAHFQLCP